jgi:uncharacterized protein
MTREMIMLPGIGGSGEDHWQSHWQARDAGIRRFAPSSWDRPDLEDWIAALDREIARSSAPPFLIAHSLACLLVAHWSARGDRRVAGALLVAPPDPTSAAFPEEAAGFAHPPALRLRFPALVVASSNDPYGSLGHARAVANLWGASLVEAGALGHINGAGGLGDWPRGWAIFTAFAEGLAQPSA